MTQKLLDASQTNFEQERSAHWSSLAQTTSRMGGYYHRRLAQIYQFLIPPNQKILEVGCGQGHLLSKLKPSKGVGIDFSSKMIHQAKQYYPHLSFIQTNAHTLALSETFDFIVLSDLINDVWDVQTVLEQLKPLTTPRTRLIFNFYSHLWETPLTLAAKLKLAQPTLYQNWLTVEDVTGLLELSGFDVIRNWQEILWPVQTPVLNPLFNHFAVKLWPLSQLALSNFIVAQPQRTPPDLSKEPGVSVVIPARNEAGNIAQIIKRTPEMGRGTELIFVEGHSKDDTYQAIEKEIAAHPERKCKLFQQTGVGKGDAVRLGFSQATGDILMILDADMTVPPEDLPRFYKAIRSNNGEFINGVRLVYPMEQEAMRVLNLWGNKFFSLAFSWLLGQPIKDTLCGTKVLWKSDYELIAANREYFGDFDPFGDYDLIFGAAKLGLRIVDLPIRYRERVYGTTNINRWSHGWLLLRMVAFAAGRIKFI